MSRGATPLIFYRDEAPVGLLNVSDPIRPVAIQTIEQFKKLGIHQLVILSGDHEKAVRRVADSVGISDVHPLVA